MINTKLLLSNSCSHKTHFPPLGDLQITKKEFHEYHLVSSFTHLLLLLVVSRLSSVTLKAPIIELYGYRRNFMRKSNLKQLVCKQVSIVIDDEL